MDDPPDAYRALARRILYGDKGQLRTAAEPRQAIEQAFRQFCAIMATVIGSGGIAAIMERAAHLTRSVFPWFETPSSPDDPALSIERITAGIEREGREQAEKCAVDLLAHAIVLLSTFIGEQLTLRMLRRGYKDRFRDDAGSGSEEA